ncbi:MAG: acyltransferase [Deltaproteobacteria bacterium]|nr:acyltransferase [Deltaproteobacteria bacterium]
MRFQSIEKLRGLACLLIILHHTHHPTIDYNWLPLGMRQGWAGVHVFFVISGFVVALYMLRIMDDVEGPTFLARLIQKRGVIVEFLVRRFFRLAPVAVLGLAFIAACFSLFNFLEPLALSHPARMFQVFRTLAETLVPVYNLTISTYGFSDANRLCLAPYWSLSIEDQFYLLLPLLFVAIPSNSSRFRFALIASAVGAFVVRPLFHVLFTHVYTINALYSHTITNFDGLFLGVALGLLFAELAATGAPAGRPSSRSSWLAGAIVVLSFVFIWLYPSRHGEGTDRGRNVMHVYILVAALSGLSVWLCATFERRGRDILHFPIIGPVLDYLGARSYTLYVFHMMVAKVARYAIVDPRWDSDPYRPLILAGVFIGLLLTVTEAVHRLVELPMRELGKRYAATFRKTPEAVATALSG